MTNQANEVLSFYAPYFKNWQVKLVGEKPTAAMLQAIHGLGPRPGKQALAIAMTLRPSGATNSQIVIVCGAPQNNKRTDLVTDGLLKRILVPDDSKGHTVYKTEVTAKGQKRIDTHVKAAADLEARGQAKADKAKAKPEPVKAKVAKAEPVKTPTVAADASKAEPVKVTGKANKRISKPAKPVQVPLTPVSYGAGIDSLNY